MATKSILGRFSEFKTDGIYLLGPMKEKGDAEKELEVLQKTKLETMWLSELDTLKSQYEKYKEHRAQIQNGVVKSSVKKVKRVVKK